MCTTFGRHSNYQGMHYQAENYLAGHYCLPSRRLVVYENRAPNSQPSAVKKNPSSKLSEIGPGSA